MAWAIDTCILLDLMAADDAAAMSAEGCLDRHRADGLVVCPITCVELVPSFPDNALIRGFLADYGVLEEQWSPEDQERAETVWRRHVRRRRADPAHPRRPLADLLIGAFALGRHGLITRNGGDFVGEFPGLVVRGATER